MNASLSLFCCYNFIYSMSGQFFPQILGQVKCCYAINISVSVTSSGVEREWQLFRISCCCVCYHNMKIPWTHSLCTKQIRYLYHFPGASHHFFTSMPWGMIDLKCINNKILFLVILKLITYFVCFKWCVTFETNRQE